MIETHRPDAVVGFSDWDYYALEGVLDAGVDPIGFAAEEIHGQLPEGLVISGTAGRAKDMGVAAIEWLDQLIRMTRFGVPEEPRFQGFSPQWIEGDTLPHKETVSFC